MLLKYTARRENLYTFIIVFISEFVQIFTPRPVKPTKHLEALKLGK